MNESTPAQNWEEIQKHVAALKKEFATTVVGQEKIIEQMLVALLCRGHCLIVGVPGLAKTLLCRTMGAVLGLKFQRIQFTPDLMPMDIIGCEILQDGGDGMRRAFEFSRGPIFANLILADEINRTPPKTQAALLEAMQEKQVTVSGKTMRLEEPFIVFATQNPIEQEGTYPLPEAQLDRFFFQLLIDYPDFDAEKNIVRQTTVDSNAAPRCILHADQVLAMQHAVTEVPLPDNVLDYILRLVHATRPKNTLADDFIRQYVAWGAGPRAAQNLARAACALALLRGQPTASVEVVKEVAPAILRHRIIPNYNATGEGITVEAIVEHLLKVVR